MSGKAFTPQMKKFMDKQVKIKLTCNRYVSGTFRGFDPFMNTVLDNVVDESLPDKPSIGLVVIRGNSIIMIENMEQDAAKADGAAPAANPNMNRR